MSEIITRVVHFGQKSFSEYKSPNPFKSSQVSHTHTTYQESNFLYNEAIRSIARNSDVELNDIETEFFKAIQENRHSLAELLLPGDNLHLSKKGHDLYYSLIYPKIENAVSEIISK